MGTFSEPSETILSSSLSSKLASLAWCLSRVATFSFQCSPRCIEVHRVSTSETMPHPITRALRSRIGIVVFFMLFGSPTAGLNLRWMNATYLKICRRLQACVVSLHPRVPEQSDEDDTVIDSDQGDEHQYGPCPNSRQGPLDERGIEAILFRVVDKARRSFACLLMSFRQGYMWC